MTTVIDDRRQDAPPAPNVTTPPAGTNRVLDALYDVGSRLLAVFVVAFLLAPVVVVVIVSFSTSGIEFWPRSFGWDAYGDIPGYMFEALWLSTRLAAVAVVISLVLTIPLAVAMVRGRLPGRSLVEAFFRSPLQLPALVLGVALYQYFIFIGSSGVTLRGTFIGLVVGHVIAITPFLLSAAVGRLSEMDPVIEDAAAGLGAGFFRVLLRVTLPQMRPGLVAGSFLAFLVSFNDVALSVFLTGAGQSPLPVVMLSDAETMPGVYLYAISAVVVVLSLVACVAVDRLVGLRSVVGAAR
ncbi:ABC transporter permease [Nocardioides zeae]|uniref:Spermidine/putrescine transport system permease protein n=1 Tax=Nocardioides zeae TaxID=1457234 RepID=A0AAJ1U512_9ACTN|nr:ABC transporter permease subunit [Nocardioides zeae]MDQ1105708.1 putative spermidine/putrescine transport system permease protein [Nocardioides zeae]